MTMQSRSNRYYWRQRTRRLMHLINALIATMVLLAVLLPGQASAAPACPNGVCTGQPDRLTLCAWPAVIGGQRVAYCVRYAPEVQP